MPITRRLISQHDEKVQQLRVGYSGRYIANDTRDWQMLLGPNSSFVSGTPILKIATKFDENELDKIKFIAYLYNTTTGNVDNAATCKFNVYNVIGTTWDDNLVGSFSGSQLPNSYFYAEQLLSYFTPAELDGGPSLMVEVVVTRLSRTFRDRIYLNHLGSYETLLSLKQDVEFLDLTKVDE